MKYVQQTITQVEVDTDTGNIRLLKAFTKNLGAGNGTKKIKPKDLDTGEIEVQER